MSGATSGCLHLQGLSGIDLECSAGHFCCVTQVVLILRSDLPLISYHRLGLLGRFVCCHIPLVAAMFLDPFDGCGSCPLAAYPRYYCPFHRAIAPQFGPHRRSSPVDYNVIERLDHLLIVESDAYVLVLWCRDDACYEAHEFGLDG